MSKLVIILLTMATAAVHFSFFIADPTTRGLIYAANALGYVILVTLLYLPWSVLDHRRGLMRGALMGFAALTIAAYVVFLFVARVLMRTDGAMRSVDYEMVGMLGHVSSPILGEHGIGEMIYSHEGSRRHVAIRSEQLVPIEKGTEVVVTRYERGVAYVRRWDELSGL